MAINNFGSGSGAGGGGANHIVAHSEILGAGATWHWPFVGADDGTESLVGGATVDLVNVVGYPAEPEGTAGVLDARRSTSSVATGTIGAAVRITGAITVAGWFCRDAANGTNMALIGARIVGGGSANNIQWELGLTSANLVRWIHQDGASDNTNIIEATGALTLDTWEHWTATRNAAGTIAKLYKNGVLNATSGTLIQADGGGNVSKITVANSLGGAEFPGLVKTPIIYEEEMDADGVLALYNSTASSGSW